MVNYFAAILGKIILIILFAALLLSSLIRINIIINVLLYLLIAVLLLIFAILIAVSLWTMLSMFNHVRRMREGEIEIERTPDNDEKILDSLTDSYRLFLEKNKFRFDGSFRYGENLILAYWKKDEIMKPERGFIFYLPQSMPEFTTIFNPECSLTSGGHASAFIFPRPYGAFIQSKKIKNIDQLWQYHLEAEQFLVEQNFVEISQNFVFNLEDHIRQLAIKQGKYISKIPLFWLRAPYWFYIKRFQMLGVSIQQQLTKRKRSN